MDLIILFIGLICSVIGVYFLYDTRKIVSNFFSFKDVNRGVKHLKILGCLALIFGLIAVYIYLPNVVTIIIER